MFTITKVDVDDLKVWRQCNRPGGTGGVGAYRDAWLSQAKTVAVASSPVNDPLNAVHRGGVVGTYKASWRVSHDAAPVWVAAGRLSNTADHAIIVEKGRSESRKPQLFSWTKWGGKIKWVGIDPSKARYAAGFPVSGKMSTKARAGSHVAEFSVEYAAKQPSPFAVARANNPYVPMM